MKKVLHIIGGMDRGGAESYVMNTVRHIDSKKYKIDILTFMAPRDGDKYVYADELKKMGVKIITIDDTRFRKPWKFIGDIAKVVKDGKYDIVHSHIDFMSSLSLAGARKGGAKKRISHSHNTGNERLKSKKNRIMAAFLRRKLNREATTRLACGQLAGEFLYGHKKPFTVIHNGIDISRFKYNTNTRKKMREKYKIDEDAVVLLNVGRLEEAKNQNQLIDIFADFSRKHKNARLFIIGDGSLQLVLEDKIASEYLGDKVVLMPSLDDIEGFYAMADVFVMPSLFEGVPTAGIEAQASGMRCVFSDKVPEEVKLLDSTVFLPLNGDWLSYIKPADESRGNAVKNAAVKEYDIKNTVKKLEEVYG